MNSQPCQNIYEQNMVKVGEFTVELVQAGSKDAFKEHTSPSNQVYAEVEPGLEYFVRIGTSTGGVRVELTVDGTFPVPNSGMSLGSWERKNGVDKMTALCFNLAYANANGGTFSMLTGKVEAAFYKLGILSHEAPKDFASKELTAESKTLGGKKCVVSTNGRYELDDKLYNSKANTSVAYYGRGEHVQTVSLFYCTTVGLIANKILGEPPETTNDENAGVKAEKKSHIKTEKPKAVAPTVLAKLENKRACQIKTKKKALVPFTYEDEESDSDATVALESLVIDLTGDDEE